MLVSFDGFRWDYAERVDTPALDRLAAAGVRAERLIPVFPSKTFPGHYSIVTGLYPGHHGIISNNMRDPRWPEVFGLGRRDEVQNGRWWGGEPIWLTAENAGMRSAVYFWPGSEAPVQGVQATWWYPYDGAVAFDDRVDQALEWLALPASERPGFVALYFDEPNEAGHAAGPFAPETDEAVRRVDTILGRLLDGLEGQGTAANVIVVSDHGMAQNDPERVIYLEDYVELQADELFEFGAMVQIFPGEDREELIHENLVGAHPHMRVWRRDEIPERLGTFDSPRLPPIVGSPDAGWEVLPRRGGPPRVVPGDHGQDPSHPSVQGIFYAAGPDLREGVTIPAIEQVDIYNLMARLLRLDPAPNDGDASRVLGLLRR